MRISVLTERAEGELRVALVPENVAKLVKAGATVVVQKGAGARAFHADAAYTAAGATLAETAAEAVAGADVIAKVQRPLADEMALLPAGVALICLLQAQSAGDLIQQLATQKVSTLALERVREEYPFFLPFTIPANTYSGQPEPIDTVGVDNVLMCREDLDDELVYRLTKVFFEALPALAATHGDSSH